jgi:hypothetical protein
VPSLVYTHPLLYRFGMNVLYRGKYERRFNDIVALIDRDCRSVCDLCFGDTFIAEWCRGRGIRWTGVDLNPRFCARGRRRGFEVVEGDLFSVDVPEADVFIVAGSLYHFYADLGRLFDLIWRRTDKLILLEPVRNLSMNAGPLGWLARRSSNPGNGQAGFRFDEQSLMVALRAQQARHSFDLQVVSVSRDMLLVLDRRT